MNKFFLETLPEEQKTIFPLLEPVSKEGFVLFEETAIALQLGHRLSVDFDFFRSNPLNKEEKTKLTKLDFMKNFEILQNEEDTFVVVTNGVKISFFGGIDFVNRCNPITYQKINIATLPDLLATKLAVVTQRVEYKDYTDIANILKLPSITLKDGLQKAKEFYGNQFSIQDILKTINYFKGGDLDKLKDSEKNILEEAVKNFYQPSYSISKTYNVSQSYEAVTIPMDEILLKLGYTYKREKCTKRNFTMTNENGDLVVISRMPNEHYLYFNPFNDLDKGNIHNFCKNRGVSLKDVLFHNTFECSHKLEYADPKNRQDASMKAVFDFDKFLEAKGNSNYLESTRFISKEITDNFPIKIDTHNNMCFPHYALRIKASFKKGEKEELELGMSGYSLKFRIPLIRDKEGNMLDKPIKGICYGNKGLEILKAKECTHFQKVQNIIITESSIDSLSLFELKTKIIDDNQDRKNFTLENTLLCATGGNKNEAITKAIAFMRDNAPNAIFILAFDNDEKGRYFSEQIKNILKGREVQEEQSQFKDFNDDLKAYKILQEGKLNFKEELNLKEALEKHTCKMMKDLQRMHPEKIKETIERLKIIQSIKPFNPIQETAYKKIIQERQKGRER